MNVTKEFLEAQVKVWMSEAADFILDSHKVFIDREFAPPKPSENLIQGAEAIKAFSK